MLRPAIQSDECFLHSFHSYRGSVGGRPSEQVFSIKRTAEGRRHKSSKIINVNREKNRIKNGSSRKTSVGLDFEEPRKHACQKGPIESEAKEAKQAGRPAEISLWKRTICQAESKALEISI